MVAEAEMVIDLAAIAANYRLLAALSPQADCAPVIKGDGYGHGMVECAATLAQAGARFFYVATLEDAAQLAETMRPAHRSPAVRIAVLGGILPGEERTFQQHGLLPVLNDAGQLARWSAAARAAGQPLAAVVHIDTGMNRLGLVASDLARLASEPALHEGIHVTHLMSHLASADDLDMQPCAAQRDALLRHAALFPGAQRSLANSHGSFFGADYRLDQYRPGQALYGIPSTPGLLNPLRAAITVTAPLLQVKTVGRGEAVGYSSTWRATGATRIATVGIGYANGYPRAASSGPNGPVAAIAIGGQPCAIVGRVSMDLLTVDVTDVPDPLLVPGGRVEIVGPAIGLDDLAAAGRTIERDLTIALGHGCKRRWIGGEG